MSSPRGRGPIVLALAVALVVSSCSGGSKHRATSGASTLLPAASGSVTSSSSEESSPAVADSTIAGSAGGARTPTVGSTKKPPAVVGVAGARTAGDVLFPALGNGGYDVTHYDLALDWHQTPPQLVAVATIDAIATESLSAFSLDFTGLDIDAVTVDGSAAEARSVDEKLDVTLAKSIVKGAKFSTIVRYHGDPGLSHGGARIRTGWFTVPDGAYTLDEPDGAHHWFPSNDHPSDKATFTFHVTVDAGQNAVANGRETARTAQAGRVTITSQATEPMAPYLAVVAIGPYSVTSGPGPHRTTLRDVVPANGPVPPGSFLPSIGSQIDFFEQRFGPLPFDSYGVLLAPSQPVLALETQTLSTLSAADYPGPPDVNPGDPANDLADEVRAHELAHQWFGDAVTPSTWRDIWLSEGFATYAQWLWASRDDSSILDERAEAARLHSVSVRAQYGATDDPSATNLFSPSVYDEGAMVLHALRADMGDALFFRLLQDWVDGHRYGTGSTEAFIALASKDAGHDEAALLHLWLSSMDPLPAFPGS